MKILISSSYYAPHISGLTNSIKNLAELLAKKDYKISVLTTQHNKNLAKKEIIKGVNVVRVSYLFKIHKGFFMPYFSLVALRAIQKADQVIIGLPQMEGCFIALVAKLMRKRLHVIYTCEVTVGNIFGGKIIEAVMHASNKISLFFADNIIVLTADFGAHAILLKGKSKKLHTIYPVIIPPITDPVSQKYFGRRLSSKRYHIGFLGRIAPEKGIEYLISAIPLLRKSLDNNFTIVLAGPLHAVGEKKYLQTMDKLIKENKEVILQLGELQENELGAFYSLMDVIVLPSVNMTEAFGMVQVEAMFCGTPVVATDLPGVSSIVQVTGMGEIAKKRDISDLAKKINKVIKNKHSYIRERKKIAKIFATDDIFLQYEQLFKN
ncbi:MAG TPA: glycosyltransferase family 4 protein [Candidatus Sulfotelmatobacter sp.]|jgi:glycosyltransferase involved in cell wall biosynthesis|nr:glycosyltransferase family 4 protein [Candidatus Sulfotelmatobacter sp.]